VQESATTKVQAIIRQYLARKRVRTLRAGHSERESKRRAEQAALIMGRVLKKVYFMAPAWYQWFEVYRRLTEAMQARHLTRVSSIIKIQSIYRGHHRRQRYLSMRTLRIFKTTKAMLKINKFVRERWVLVDSNHLFLWLRVNSEIFLKSYFCYPYCT